jgi:hypothetical protein
MTPTRKRVALAIEVVTGIFVLWLLPGLFSDRPPPSQAPLVMHLSGAAK